MLRYFQRNSRQRGKEPQTVAVADSSGILCSISSGTLLEGETRGGGKREGEAERNACAGLSAAGDLLTTCARPGPLAVGGACGLNTSATVHPHRAASFVQRLGRGVSRAYIMDTAPPSATPLCGWATAASAASGSYAAALPSVPVLDQPVPAARRHAARLLRVPLAADAHLIVRLEAAHNLRGGGGVFVFVCYVLLFVGAGGRMRPCGARRPARQG